MGWHDAVSVRRDCGREELIKSNRVGVLGVLGAA
jgi:hypothetical protein